jgi:hypothetical protein
MIPTPVSRADRHCHSAASQDSRPAVQDALGLPECATPPEEVYGSPAAARTRSTRSPHRSRRATAAGYRRALGADALSGAEIRRTAA